MNMFHSYFVPWHCIRRKKIFSITLTHTQTKFYFSIRTNRYVHVLFSLQFSNSIVLVSQWNGEYTEFERSKSNFLCWCQKKEHSVSMADQSNYELSEKKMSVWYAKLLMWMNPNRMNVSHARNSLSICVLRCHSCHMRQIDGCVALSHCFSYCFHEQKISDKVSVSEFHTINKLRATDTSGIKKKYKNKMICRKDVTPIWNAFSMLILDSVFI